jgi:hypothetical protein
MAKKPYTLSELESSHEGPFTHTSHRESRESIQKRGLVPSQPVGWGDEHQGVYVFEHPGETPSSHWAENASQYGGDIYHVNKPKNTKVYSDEQDAGGGFFFHKTIRHSDFKRTGHIFRNDDGHTQVHWHKEEECPEGKMASPMSHIGEQISRHSKGL